MNSYILNSYKRQKSLANNAEELNLFSIESSKGIEYLPSCIKLDCYGLVKKSDSSENIYCFEINDKEIFAFTDLVFTFTVPELYSNHKIAYIPWFGYKIIKSVTIKDGDEVLLTLDPITIFSRAAKKHPELLKYGGHSRELNDFTICESENLIDQKRYYLPRETIHVNIETHLLEKSTFTSFKNLENSKIKIEIATYPELNSVMVYSPDAQFKDVYMKDKKNLEIENPTLNIMGYTTDKTVDIDPLYVNTQREVVGNFNTPDEITVGSISTISSLHWSVANNLSGKIFSAYPGFDQSEHAYITAFLNRIVNDLLVVTKDKESISKLGYSNKSQFEEVVKNKVKLSSKTVNIYIENIDPDEFKVFYHTNILSHKSRKNEISYNISEKFNFIHGLYNPVKNNITIINIDHNITIADISIPIEMWTLNTNTDDGDNRKESSKQDDVIINDPFLRGIDLINKTDPFTNVVVKHGNEVIFESKNSIQYFMIQKLNRNIHIPGQVLPYGGMTFNKTNDVEIIESFLQSDHQRGKNNIKIEATYKKLNETSPSNLISKALIVNCIGAAYIKEQDKRNVLVEINSN
ncbi:trimeric virion coat protein [Carp edema virus]|nr:trimeric virion coat protein [Carp edema virus]